MLTLSTIRKITLFSLVSCFIGTFRIPVQANPIPISAGSPNAKILRGYTRGTVGLHNIVGERDQRRNRCMGYGSASPDHQIQLQPGRAQISFQVQSKRRDTTLVVKGPGSSIFCADDSPLGKDAGLKLNNLPPGRYEIWVGAFDAGENFAYTLSIQ